MPRKAKKGKGRKGDWLWQRPLSPKQRRDFVAAEKRRQLKRRQQLGKIRYPRRGGRYKRWLAKRKRPVAAATVDVTAIRTIRPIAAELQAMVFHALEDLWASLVDDNECFTPEDLEKIRKGEEEIGRMDCLTPDEVRQALGRPTKGD